MLIQKKLSVCPEHVVGYVGVDLKAVRHNFCYFKQKLNHTTIAAVLKSNAYGLGYQQIAQVLIAEGCKDFFVATIEEGRELRCVSKNINIYVLYGLYQNTEESFVTYNLIPVLNTYEQIKRWDQFGKMRSKKNPCVIHYDAGMSRTGLDYEDAENFIKNKDQFKHLDILYVMSHLSASEDVQNPLNKEQLEKFEKFSAHFPGVQQSLTATPALYMGKEFQKDMTRIGYGLYGFWNPHRQYDLKNVLYVYSRIVQVRQSKKGDTVGYGATHTMQQDGVLATLSMGYADGYHRFLHNYKPYVCIDGHKAPLVGRISMDFCVVDVTHIPHDLIYEGAWVEMIGENILVDDLVFGTQFVPHEVPIHLGKRYHWEYIS